MHYRILAHGLDMRPLPRNGVKGHPSNPAHILSVLAFSALPSNQCVVPNGFPLYETKFLCITAEVEIGSLIDGWEVVWCQPRRRRVVWHVMVTRRKLNSAAVAVDGLVSLWGNRSVDIAKTRFHRSLEIGIARPARLKCRMVFSPLISHEERPKCKNYTSYGWYQQECPRGPSRYQVPASPHVEFGSTECSIKKISCDDQASNTFIPIRASSIHQRPFL